MTMSHRSRLLLLLCFFFSSTLWAQNATIVDIKVRGNGKVESDAIVTLLKSHKGYTLNPDLIKDDIKALYQLGYFSDVRVFKTEVPGGINLVIQVVEKPAITRLMPPGTSVLKTQTSEK